MRIATATLLTSACFVMGCASMFSDLSGKRASLEDAQRRYTELVRWGQIERASGFVDPELVDEYMEHAAAFEGIRVTDFESGGLEFDSERDTATVVVVYHAYSMKTLLEKRIRENQRWFREEGMSNTWRVQPDLRQIIAGVTSGL